VKNLAKSKDEDGVGGVLDYSLVSRCFLYSGKYRRDISTWQDASWKDTITCMHFQTIKKQKNEEEK
jgi:hypothetical protein